VRVQIDNETHRSLLQPRFYRTGLVWLSPNLNKFELLVTQKDDLSDTVNIWGNMTTQLYITFLEATQKLVPVLVELSEARRKREGHALKISTRISELSQACGLFCIAPNWN